MLLAVADASPWLAVFGRAHPLLLHLPIGILPALAVLEFGAAICRRPLPRGAVLTLAWVGALMAALAVVSGLVLADEPGYGGDLVSQHKIAGITFASLCVVVALLAPLQRRAPMRISLVLALGAMLPTGHLGGSLSHGNDFLTEPFESVPPANASEFVRTIAPMLEHCCTKCHNAHKHKGGLDLTTTTSIAAGSENGKVVIAGKPDDSDLLQRCLLAEDDDDAMPPSGKQPRPTAAQLDTLKQWIAAGAKFD